jgi:rubrerythrin
MRSQKRKTFRALKAVAAISIAALLLAACAEPKSETPTAEAKAEPAATKATEPPPPKPADKTLANLTAALAGETNANARYAAFAAKADAEGYKDVAKLFRAASRAEKVHADALAALVAAAGGGPAPTAAAPEVKGTAENLQAALAGETNEFEKMYPEFIATARAEAKMDAVRVFNGAKAAEESHAKFYKEAADNLEQWKQGSREFFVCGVCGYTVAKLDFEACPICFVPKGKYEKID